MTIKFGALRILIVDGDKVFVESLVQRFRELQNATTVIEVCASGAEMLERVYRQSYDIIFLDMRPPDMDGLDVLSRASQTTLPLPIVMMAQDNARVAVEALKRGVLDFFVKEDLLRLDLANMLPRLLEKAYLRRENVELQQIGRMKDDFLATISHELRTPLTSILGLSEILLNGRMGPLQDKQAESLKKILEQSQNLVRLINQLLDIRALTLEDRPMEMQPVSLRDMVGQQTVAMKSLFEKKGVTLVAGENGDPLRIRADAGSLHKVVEHILTNALKFTPQGGTVKVDVKRIDTGHVQFKVVDTGRGIPPEALAYVFQKFYHVDQTLTRPYGGMGLGLAFCKEVVEAHGGRIWVESKGLGQGALVSILLPPMVDDAQPALAPARKAEVAWKRILWVDDNPNMLEMVKYNFANFEPPVEIVTAVSGVAALREAKSQPPDLIVLDVMMSDMDGFEILDRLKADPATRDVPVLVVSGYHEAARSALNRGAVDYCLKPYRAQDITAKVEAWLTKPRP